MTIFEQHAHEIKGKENKETASQEARDFMRKSAFASLSHKISMEMARCDKTMRSASSDRLNESLEAAIRRRALEWVAEQFNQVIRDGKEDTV